MDDISLENIDWNKEPYVTGLQLRQMRPHMASWFRNQPNIWRGDFNTDCLYNMAHPDNTNRLIRGLIDEATHAR